ncbi:MAG: M48 family metallopeptidase [Bacilli bacterium]|nr:M48 family metallopeptidase [Bacilli bacterium]
MVFLYNDKKYDIVIEKKRTTKNTYLRVKDDMKIHITTNFLTPNKFIEKFINDNYNSVIKMIERQEQKKEANTGFRYLGKKYDIVYTDSKKVILGENKVFMNKDTDIDKWYKKQAKTIFQEELDRLYDEYCYEIPYPNLRIRKMTSRWGVCNTKLKTITLNLELIKRDLKYLDYVIVHELSHLIEANHSSKFWKLVEDNFKDYKKVRKEMKEF